MKLKDRVLAYVYDFLELDSSILANNQDTKVLANIVSSKLNGTPIDLDGVNVFSVKSINAGILKHISKGNSLLESFFELDLPSATIDNIVSARMVTSFFEEKDNSPNIVEATLTGQSMILENYGFYEKRTVHRRSYIWEDDTTDAYIRLTFYMKSIDILYKGERWNDCREFPKDVKYDLDWAAESKNGLAKVALAKEAITKILKVRGFDDVTVKEMELPYDVRNKITNRIKKFNAPYTEA